MSEIAPAIGKREAQPAEHWIKEAGVAPWREIDAMPRRQDAEPHGEEHELDCLAAARVFATPDGGRVLERLLDETLRRPMWLAGVPDKVDYVVYREGQNAVAWALLKLIAQGRDEKPPQREGT